MTTTIELVKVYCAWCGQLQRIVEMEVSDDPRTRGMDSHGICPTCKDRLEKEWGIAETKTVPVTVTSPIPNTATMTYYSSSLVDLEDSEDWEVIEVLEEAILPPWVKYNCEGWAGDC